MFPSSLDPILSSPRDAPWIRRSALWVTAWAMLFVAALLWTPGGGSMLAIAVLGPLLGWAFRVWQAPRPVLARVPRARR